MPWARLRYVLALRLRSVFRSAIVDEEMEEEMRFHLECKVSEEMTRGANDREARYRALRAMGGLQQRKQEMRDMRQVHWFTDLAADLRYAARAISHSKLFAVLVALTLGRGIGANSTIFSLADAVLLAAFARVAAERNCHP